jgi:hydrogenase maturation protease
MLSGGWLEPTLIIGYGNADRQDDGLAWHVMNRLAARLGRPISSTPEEGFEENTPAPEMLFILQLVPELAEFAAKFSRVCFIDAHTGDIPVELQIQPVTGEFQASPFTHHMTASTLLAFCEQLYGQKPEAILVSARGYQFGFSRTLSERTSELVEQATDLIWDWLQKGNE